MTLLGWITIAVAVCVVAAAIANLASMDVLFVAAAVFLLIIGAVKQESAFNGFKNPGVLTVAALFVVAAAMRETGVLDFLGNWVLGRARTDRAATVRLAGLVVPLSAFLNNTPIVAMMAPAVLDWCRRVQIAPSRLLIPLSYLAILGGTCTLIGTSTNLVVHGMLIDEHKRVESTDPPAVDAAQHQRELVGLRGIGMFEVGLIGLPYALVGFTYLMTVGQRLLPHRKELLEQLGESRREFLVEMFVQPSCRLVGQSIEQAGLRQLAGLFLIEIDRGQRVITPVDPAETIEAHDRLVFTGVVSSIVDLEKIPGLVPAADPSYEALPRDQRGRLLCEAVVSPTSPLIGKSVRKADFRAQYNAAVVAVHRNGARVTNKVGDIVLQSGDTLLLQTTSHFVRAHRNNADFYLVSSVHEWRPLRRDRAGIAIVVFIALIVAMTAGWLEPHVAAIGAAVAMILLGCISGGDARQSIEWQVLLTVAASFAIGAALEETGAAEYIAGGIVQATQSCGSWAPWVALAAIYLMAMLMTEMITNNAAAVLMFPFCLETARLLDVSPRPFVMALVLAASASFATPIGYQTNMMVYGPGGYRFSDFLRVGAPLNLTLWVVAVTLIPLIWPF